MAPHDPPVTVSTDTLEETLIDVRRHLAWQADAGFVDIAREQPSVPSLPRPSLAAGSRAAAAVARVPHGSPGVASAARAPLATLTEPPPGERKTLDEVRRELGDCRRCGLCAGRTTLVFGAGDPNAELVFVGEGPGHDEDLQGLPFVGNAGQLLTKMIEAMGFTRDEVYICNVVKCRPPNNRNPEPEEIAACEPFLKAQLQSIRPKAVVALGKFAAQTLLKDATPISKLRGTWRSYEGVRLMPTFHPAYLLRNPDDKRLAWSDLQQVMGFFGRDGRKR